MLRHVVVNASLTDCAGARACGEGGGALECKVPPYTAKLCDGPVATPTCEACFVKHSCLTMTWRSYVLTASEAQCSAAASAVFIFCLWPSACIMSCPWHPL